MDLERPYNTNQAARFVGLSPRTLEKMRCVGGGPEYSRNGRKVVYYPEQLRVWIAANTRRSTSEAATLA